MKRKFSHLILAIFFLFIAFLSHAESPDIDSLSAAFERTRDKAEALQILKEIGWEYVFVDPDSSLAISEMGLSIAREEGSFLMEAQFLSNKAEAFRSKGEYGQSIDLLIQSLSINEKINSELGQANCLNRIGAVYIEMQQLSTAIDYFMRALVKFESLRDLKGASSTLNNIGACYYYQEDYDKAVDFFKRSLAIEEQIGNKRGISESYMNVGAVLFGVGKYTESEEYFLKALAISEEAGDISTIGGIYNNLGNLFLQQKKTSEAIEKFSLALDIAKKLGNSDDIRSFLLNLSKAYAQSGNYKEAYEMMGDFLEYRDSALNEENQKAVAEMTTKYQSEKKEKENQLLKKNSQIKDLEIEKQKTTVFAVSAGLVLMIFAGFTVYFAYRQKKKANIILKQQRDTIASQKKDLTDSIQYARHLQDAILPETERLHDLFSDHFVLYQPKDIVSGDFFWFYENEDFVFLAVADCTGHGVPGAMVSMVCHNALQRSVSEFGLISTGKILDNCASLIEKTFSANHNSVKDGMDISLIRIERTTGNAEWSGANNPLWLIRSDAGEVEVVKPDPQPIGSFFGRNSFHTHAMKLNKGDCFYLFSDGYVDQFGGPDGKKFKAGAFRKLLLSNKSKEMSIQRALLLSVFEEWKGEIEQVDDVCVLGVRI